MLDKLLSSEFYCTNDILAEHEILPRIHELGAQNKVWRSYIGQGYHNVRLPTTIARNILENPGW